jgi:hypothetical protein
MVITCERLLFCRAALVAGLSKQPSRKHEHPTSLHHSAELSSLSLPFARHLLSYHHRNLVIVVAQALRSHSYATSHHGFMATEEEEGRPRRPCRDCGHGRVSYGIDHDRAILLI